MESDTLTCTKCELVLPLTDFYVEKKLKRGYSYYCKNCSRQQDREYRKNKKEKELGERFAIYRYKLVCRICGAALASSFRAKHHFINKHLNYEN